jgi:LuxR family maltose regulon positive regulatory protein
LAIAEHFFGDEVITVPQAWVLVRLAAVRCRRGRLEQAQATLQQALEALETFTDGGRVPLLAAEVQRELDRERTRVSEGDMRERPSAAEISVLRLLDSDLSVRQIGAELFVSPNTVRSHTRSIYRKLGVNSRADAIARAELLGLLERTQSPM